MEQSRPDFIFFDGKTKDSANKTVFCCAPREEDSEVLVSISMERAYLGTTIAPTEDTLQYRRWIIRWLCNCDRNRKSPISNASRQTAISLLDDYVRKWPLSNRDHATSVMVACLCIASKYHDDTGPWSLYMHSFGCGHLWIDVAAVNKEELIILQTIGWKVDRIVPCLFALRSNLPPDVAQLAIYLSNIFARTGLSLTTAPQTIIMVSVWFAVQFLNSRPEDLVISDEEWNEKTSLLEMPPDALYTCYLLLRDEVCPSTDVAPADATPSIDDDWRYLFIEAYHPRIYSAIYAMRLA